MTHGVKLCAENHKRLRQICSESQLSCGHVSVSMKLSHELLLHRLRVRGAQAAVVLWQLQRGWGLQQNCPHCCDMLALIKIKQPHCV